MCFKHIKVHLFSSWVSQLICAQLNHWHQRHRQQRQSGGIVVSLLWSAWYALK